jgi:hypothetical protein
MFTIQDLKNHLHVLSLLALSPARAREVVPYVAGLDEGQRAHLLALTDSHHVVLRALQPLAQAAAKAGVSDVAEFAQTALAKERARIENGLAFLNAICREVESAGWPVVVIKTLDHWPDFGNDLDLFTQTDHEFVAQLLFGKFKASRLPRTVGDHLANKRSYRIPGLDQEVEIHFGRLGQAGEHVDLANRFIARRRAMQAGERTFPVPAPEERVIAGTLQRMYRHLYFRVCDILNTVTLVEAGVLDYAELRAASDLGGIWPGTATFLVIASEYSGQYRGTGLMLPSDVISSARFGADKLFARDRFLCFPVMPEGAVLYTRQLKHTVMRGNLPATARLSLLPPLASAAALAYAVAGSSERIW